MTTLRKSMLTAFTAPVLLGLAACGDAAGESGDLEGDAIAAIPAPDGQEWTDTVSVSDMDGYVLGNPEAPIKLIEYGSLTCGACANFSSTSAALEEKYVKSGVVSFELRNQVQNGIDLLLARLVRCGQTESFHPLARDVWANLSPILERAQANPQAMEAAMSLPEDQRFVAAADAAGLLDYFAARGISRDQASACLADNAAVQAIADRSTEQSRELNVTGTPTFFINGNNVGTQNWTSLEPMLQQAGAR